ncbi:MAG: hypothetical protein R2778_09925 [Saprospiraceae bacterium]
MQLKIPEAVPINAIEEELKSFHASIQDNKPTVVSLQDGVDALQLAHTILREITLRKEKLQTSL